MERAPLGFCLMLRTPPGTPATHVRPRPGPEHGPGTTLSIFVEPPINVFTHMRATSRRRPVGRRKRSLCGPALTRRDLGGSTTFSAPLHSRLLLGVAVALGAENAGRRRGARSAGRSSPRKLCTEWDGAHARGVQLAMAELRS